MVKQMKGQYKVSNPGLRPLWDEARSLSRRLEGFQIQHTLRGGNKVADALANEAMDRGMGKAAGGASGVGGVSGVGGTSKSASQPVGKPASTKADRVVLEGYVKGGVVHLLEGELPDGVFVKVIRE